LPKSEVRNFKTHKTRPRTPLPTDGKWKTPIF